MPKLFIQPGFQREVFSTKADIAIIGGAMGSGKSYSLILDILKNIADPHFRCGVFRKSRQNIICSGGLWEELIGILDTHKMAYKPDKHQLKITFPSGATVVFLHANHPNFKMHLKGTQFTCIMLDEGDEFEQDTFRFLISRLRSMSKTKPYMRITTNPSDGWIKTMVNSYLTEDEYPISGESGLLKYLYFINDNPIVEKNKDDFLTKHGIRKENFKFIRTFTFISGTVNDNQKLLKNNPEYLSNLHTLSDYERDRYLYGWWGVLAQNGMFRESDFLLHTGFPEKCDRYIITIDTAIRTSQRNDYSVATCWGIKKNKLYMIDLLRGKWTYGAMRTRMEAFIEANEYIDTVYIEDIQTGAVLIDDLRVLMPHIKFRSIHRHIRQSKLNRAQEALANLSHVDVYLPANTKMRKVLLKEVCAFSADMSHKNDDIADTFFDAINIAGKAVRKRPQKNRSTKTLSHKIETLGRFTRVSA